MQLIQATKTNFLLVDLKGNAMFGFMKQGIRPEVRSTEKVHSTYRRRQAGVLAATSFTYIAYYIIRLVLQRSRCRL